MTVRHDDDLRELFAPLAVADPLRPSFGRCIGGPRRAGPARPAGRSPAWPE